LEELHRHFKGQDLVILAVSTDLAEVRLLKTFVEEHRYTFTVLHDPRRHIMEWFRTVHIPVTYLIDRSGKIIGRAVGPRDWSHKDMIRLFDGLLEQCAKDPQPRDD
jgi:peroxiredoxin